MKQPLGLTFIGFLISLIIIIALTVATVPIFINTYQKYQVTIQTQKLNDVLGYARSKALRNNQTIYVNFQVGNHWCYGVNAGSACRCNTANSCKLGSYSAARKQYTTLITTGLRNNNLTFESQPRAAHTTSAIIFTLDGNTSSMGIKITPLGNMQYCSSTYNGYTACS